MAALEQYVARVEKRVTAVDEKTKQGIETGLEETRRRETVQQRLAETRVSLEALSAELQKLNGRVEELEYQMDLKLTAQGQKSAKSEELIAANQTRIAKLEEYLNLESTAGVPVTANTAESTGNSPEKESLKDLYLKAKTAFDQGNLEYARITFEKLLERYPKSENADNAQFWIAEIYYREKWYEKAVLEYQKVIENYPKGNKLQAALLKQGFAFLEMDDKANARIILNELVKKYPSAPEAEAAKAKLQGM